MSPRRAENKKTIKVVKPPPTARPPGEGARGGQSGQIPHQAPHPETPAGLPACMLGPWETGPLRAARVPTRACFPGIGTPGKRLHL